ncbi:MAG: ABC transporter ATP-binding protein, partial [Clostridia bacterium]|nr:ABC transporter ATP-binding protein [Clostridia bacterium]
ESDLRQELFEHLTTLDFAFYDKNRVGRLMSSLTNDLLDLTELFHHAPEDYLISAVRVLGASVMLLMINPRLALIAIAFVPVLVIQTCFFGRRIKKVSYLSKERIADINAHSSDILGGIRTVKSFSNEEKQVNRFRLAGERFYKSRCDVYRNEAYNEFATRLLINLCTASVVIIGAIFVLKGEMQVSALLAFTMYITYITSPIKQLTWMITQFQSGMAGFDRVMTLLETKPDIWQAKDAVDIGIVGDISVKDVHFSYRENEPVIKDFDLELKKGSFTALVGISGSGKSTLSALIQRFYDTKSGSILIDGVDIKKISLSSLRKNIAWVQQDTYLFDCSIADNIRMGKPDASMEEIISAAKAADCHEFILSTKNGYESLVGERGVHLSGGQRQRIGIARALLKNAPIMILDEATSALDNKSEQSIYSAISSLRKERTTIVIAHRLSTIKSADRIVVISDGKIKEDGTHDELMEAKGLYFDLYRRSQ